MIILISEVALGAVISAVVSGVVAMLFQGFYGSRIDRKLNERLSERLDALAAAALKMAIEDAAEIEEASLSYPQVANRLLARRLVTSEEHDELLELWKARNTLALPPDGRGMQRVKARNFLNRTEKLIRSLGAALPP